MANHKSALKRARQSDTRRARNRINKTRVKNAVKAARLAMADSPE
ncbi:MAG: 30S ribosomal protein S20, partial [Candidatus Adiutrix sp.]|nr:30S ribosomal protein S20 [Candidatus Adiutrix sp.]